MRGDDHLTVAEAAKALGTSPQTVRTLLRTKALRGRRRTWGTRYVWEVNSEAVDEFLSEYGRLGGGRRRPRATRLQSNGDTPRAVGVSQADLLSTDHADMPRFAGSEESD